MTDTPTFHVLAELEHAMGHPIASHFDLICGTSSGGTLALGLAAEIPAQELKELLEKEDFAEVRSAVRKCLRDGMPAEAPTPPAYNFPFSATSS